MPRGSRVFPSDSNLIDDSIPRQVNQVCNYSNDDRGNGFSYIIRLVLKMKNKDVIKYVRVTYEITRLLE